MIFGIKEKSIILTYTMYCWLSLQIYLCYSWLLLWSRVTYVCIYVWMFVNNILFLKTLKWRPESADSPEECLPVWFISRCDLHLYIPVPNSLRNQTSYLQHIVQKRIMNIKLQEKENTPLHVLNKKICRELTWRSWTSKCVFTLLKIFTVQWAFFKNQSWWDCAKMWVELCWGNKVNKVWHLKETQT